MALFSKMAAAFTLTTIGTSLNEDIYATLASLRHLFLLSFQIDNHTGPWLQSALVFKILKNKPVNSAAVSVYYLNTHRDQNLCRTPQSF